MRLEPEEVEGDLGSAWALMSHWGSEAGQHLAGAVEPLLTAADDRFPPATGNGGALHPTL